MSAGVNRADQVEARLELLPGVLKFVEEAKARVEELKAELSEAKKELDKHTDRLYKLNVEIAEIRSGQNFLPFDDDDGPVAATPALDTLAAMVKEARNRNAKSPDSGIEVLVAYGVTGTTIAEIQEKLNVHTVAQLAEAISADDQWFKRCSGVGKKKVEAVVESIKKALAEHAILKEPEAGEPEEADSRKRKCLKCGEFRDQDLKVCECGNQTFELEYPAGEEAANQSIFEAGMFELVEVPDVPGVAVYVGCHPDTGMWHSCYSYDLEGHVAGRDAPHQDSEPHPSFEEAVVDALLKMAANLTGKGLGDAAGAVRDRVRELRPVEAA